MNKIRENLYLGSWQPAQNLQELKDNRITVVLNLALDQNDPDFFNEGITNIKIGLGDCDYNKPHILKFVIHILEKLLEMEEIVYVHCVSGASRSPFIIGKYLAYKENRNFEDIMKELHRLRPEVIENCVLNNGTI